MSFALCPKNAPAMFQRLHDAASPIRDLNLEDGVYPLRRNRCTHLHGRGTFWTLKHLLISSPTLCYPNFDQDFQLETDASKKGLGAVL